MKFACSHLCVCPAAGYEGIPRADGVDRKVWASGESLFSCLSFVVVCGNWAISSFGIKLQHILLTYDNKSCHIFNIVTLKVVLTQRLSGETFHQFFGNCSFGARCLKSTNLLCCHFCIVLGFKNLWDKFSRNQITGICRNMQHQWTNCLFGLLGVTSCHKNFILLLPSPHPLPLLSLGLVDTGSTIYLEEKALQKTQRITVY